MSYEIILEKARMERRAWSDDQIKADYIMWREVEASGRVLNQEQQARYEATREAVAQRHIVIDHP